MVDRPLEDFRGGIGAGPDRSGSYSQIRPSNNRLQRDRQALTWQRVALTASSAVPPPRSGAASVVVKGHLYMFGVRTANNTVP